MLLHRPTDCFAQPYFDITLSRVTPFFQFSISFFPFNISFSPFNICLLLQFNISWVCIFIFVCSADDIFLSEQMVGEAMQSAEVYDFLVTGRGGEHSSICREWTGRICVGLANQISPPCQNGFCEKSRNGFG